MKSFLLAAAAAAAVAVSVSAQSADCKNHPLLYPEQCCTLTAPDVFNATFATTVGNFSITSQRSWSPFGVDRLYSLLYCSFFGGGQERGNENGFFRVVPGFVVQFAIPGLPSVSAVWENAVIPNDPVLPGLSNTRGFIAYAAEQDASGQAFNRTTQLYINYANNSRLDAMGFTVVAQVTSEEGMKVVDSIYSGYGQDPDQDSIYAQGDAYLKANFPLLSYITGTTLVTATA